MSDIVVNRRRVQLTGTSTLSVSLPKDWTRRYNIKKGTELSISDISDGTLLVGIGEKVKDKKKVHIVTDEFNDIEELRRKFIAMYLAGYDTVSFKSNKKIPHEMRQAVLSEARRLIGFEVIDENPQELEVQDFFSHEGLSVEKSLKRTHLLICNMYEDLLTSASKKNITITTKIISRDDEIDRLKFLLLRQLSLALKDARILHELSLSTSDCINYAVIIRNMEHIADKIIKAVKYFSEITKTKIPEELNSQFDKIIRETYDIYVKAVDSFLKHDLKFANLVISRRQQLITQQENLEKNLLKRSNIPFQYSMILEDVMNIAEYSAEIAEVTINQG